MFPFQDLEYLRHGTTEQRSAYQTLTISNMLPVLRPYRPLLVGTVPIGLQLPGSDLDIICEVYDLGPFEALLRQHFGHYPGFSLRHTQRQGHACIVAGFTTGEWPIEVFGQPVSSTQQHGYRHLLIEHRLLELGGSTFRAQVQARRTAGLKTEPAFAASLGLAGDPYAALLTLEVSSDAELRASYFHDTV